MNDVVERLRDAFTKAEQRRQNIAEDEHRKVEARQLKFQAMLDEAWERQQKDKERAEAWAYHRGPGDPDWYGG